MTSDVPEFEVLIAEDGRVSFAHPGQARAYLRGKFGGQTIVAQFYEHRSKRTDRQNRGFHACITPWARERGWPIDTLKQFILSRVFGWLEFVDPTTGEVLKVLAEPHTSKLSVHQFCELIEGALELAAEDGVWLQAPDEYRKAKEQAARRDARKASAA
jgi:hypothetical protein